MGYHYTKDKTVDKPIFTAEIVVDNVIKVKEDVAYINNVFDVLNERGESILINKFDPEQLFD